MMGTRWERASREASAGRKGWPAIAAAALLLSVGPDRAAAADGWTGGEAGVKASMVSAVGSDGDLFVSTWNQCVRTSGDLGATFQQGKCPDGSTSGSIDSIFSDAPGRAYANVSGTHLVKTLDGGGSWLPLGDIPAATPGEAIQTFVMPGGATARIYAHTSGRTLRSNDGGGTWSVIGAGLSGQNADTMATDPNHPDTVLIATYDGTEFPTDTRAAVGLFKSTDGGAHFTRSDTGITGLVRAIAYLPRSSRIVLAGTNGNGVFRSTDGGATWAASSSGLTALAISRTFAFSPWNPNTVYVSTWGGGVFVSDDAGEHWTALDSGLTKLDVSSVATSPGGAVGSYRVFAATTNDGVFTLVRTPRANDAPGYVALPWQGAGAHVQASMVAPAADGSAYFSVWGGFVSRSTDRGATWSALSVPADVYNADSVVPHPTTPAKAYLSTGSAIYRTADSGASWGAALIPAGGKVHAFALAPSNPDRIYAHTSAGLMRSSDGGTTWARATAANLSGDNCDVVAVDPDHPDTVLVATYYGEEFPVDTRSWGGVFVSDDAGETFTPSASGIPTTNLVRALAFHPDTAGLVFAGVNGDGVFRSTDGGATWTAANAGLPGQYVSRTFAFSPTDPKVVYVGMWDAGVAVSYDAGLTWGPLNEGLVDTNVSSVAILPGTIAGHHTLLASTTRHGVFTLEHADVPASTAVPSQAGTGAVIALGVSGTEGRIAAAQSIPINDPAISQEGRPAELAFQEGAVQYTVVGLTPASTVNVTLTYPAALPAGSKVYKITQAGFQPFEGAVVNGDAVTLTLVDGGAGDADGLANGVIDDPVVVGVPVGGAGAGDGDGGGSGSSGGGGGCNTGDGQGALALIGLLSLAGLFGRRAIRRPG